MKFMHKTLFALAFAISPTPVLADGVPGAHGDKQGSAATSTGHGMAEMHAGMAGDSAKIDRTIYVEMSDDMRFTPDKLAVKVGETVRFSVFNKGKVPHEMVIGSTGELEEHTEMMREMPGTAHKDANQITLAPGGRGEIVWQFAKSGTLTYACLLPGHKEAGMVGTVEVS